VGIVAFLTGTCDAVCIPDSFACEGNQAGTSMQNAPTIECCSGQCEAQNPSTKNAVRFRCATSKDHPLLAADSLTEAIQQYDRYRADWVAPRKRSWSPSSIQEGLKHFRINQVIVQQLNDQRVTTGDEAEYSILHTPFADMPPHKFRTEILMNKAPMPDVGNEDTAPRHGSNIRMPEGQSFEEPNAGGVDWTARGVVTSVKDQGSLGTCWAFAAVGSVESQVAIKHGRLEDLSIEQLVECDDGRK
jgi:hypothetical protein